MAPFAFRGNVIEDGDNLVIQGVKPSGLVVNGEVIWRAAPSLPLSPDGSFLLPGTGEQLVTVDGVWTFGAGSGGLFAIQLNGSQTGAAEAALLYITNGGQLYANAGFFGWFVWTGSTWSGSLAPFTGYAAAVAADNPTSYWRLNETSGTVALDIVGANHGTYINNPALNVAGIPGTSGTAVQCSAAASQCFWLSGPSYSGAAAQNLAIEYWCRNVPLPVANFSVARDETSGTGIGYAVLFNSLNNRFGVRLSSRDIATSTLFSVLNDGSWHHVVINRTGTLASVYLDNVEVISDFTVTSTSLPVMPWRFSQNSSTGPFASATWDEIAMYPQALPQARIAVHYHLGMALFNVTVDWSAEIAATVTVQPGQAIMRYVIASGGAGLGPTTGIRQYVATAFDRQITSGAPNALVFPGDLVLGNVGVPQGGAFLMVFDQPNYIDPWSGAQDYWATFTGL